MSVIRTFPSSPMQTFSYRKLFFQQGHLEIVADYTHRGNTPMDVSFTVDKSQRFGDLENKLEPLLIGAMGCICEDVPIFIIWGCNGGQDNSLHGDARWPACRYVLALLDEGQLLLTDCASHLRRHPRWLRIQEAAADNLTDSHRRGLLYAIVHHRM